jgi:cytochrome bd-type quinol oxidase subunit 1
MDLTALLLSRLQFAFTISFHIIFPSFTIGLAAWLTVLEALGLETAEMRHIFKMRENHAGDAILKFLRLVRTYQIAG